MQSSLYTENEGRRHLYPTAQTVMPSVTLPCHMSLFHSVAPDRHGILTNTYTPQVRPINGICEQLHLYKRQAVSLQLGRVERFGARHHFLRLLYLIFILTRLQT